MKAVRIKRMARRLWVLCAMGIPFGAAISDEPRPVSEQAVVELIGPHRRNASPVSTGTGAESRSYAVLRPAKSSGMQTPFGNWMQPPAIQPTSEPSASIQKVAHLGSDNQPEVGPMQFNPLAVPPAAETASVSQPVLRAHGTATAETPSIKDTPEKTVIQTAAEIEALEFSLSEDSLDEALQETETPVNAKANQELIAKNRAAETPPALIRPSVKTHLVAKTGQNSSITIPKLPMVNEVIANAETPLPTGAATSKAEPIANKVDSASATQHLTKAATANAETMAAAESSNSTQEQKTAPEEPSADSAVTSSRRTAAGATSTVAERSKRPASIKLEPAAETAIDSPPARMPKESGTVPAHPAIATAPPAAVFSKLGEKLQSVRLKNAESQNLVIAGATQVIVEDKELCDAVAINGNILFVPKKSGGCRVAVISPGMTSDYPWIELTVESSGPVLADRVMSAQLQQLIDQRFKGAEVFIVTNLESIEVRGETISNEQAKEILLLVRTSCLCPVLDRLTIHKR
jgi:hypothetical protein